MHKTFVRLPCLAVFVLALPSITSAALVGYTSKADFLAALPGTATTLNFESQTAGDLIASGDTIGGITFTYDFGGVSMMVSDVFDTTSPDNFLGTNDADVFQGIDEFDMAFAPSAAIGLSLISADVINTDLFDDDIVLTVGSASIELDVSEIQQALGDGGNVFFLGLIDDSGTFTSASVTTSGFDSFLYNVDDIVTADAIPEPGSLALFALLGVCAGAYGWRRKRKTVSCTANSTARSPTDPLGPI
jgi:hypothetical protein